jgi:hypothetical protein
VSLEFGGKLAQHRELPSAHRRSPCDSMMEWLSPKCYASSLRLGFCGKQSLPFTFVVVLFHLSNYEGKGIVAKSILLGNHGGHVYDINR